MIEDNNNNLIWLDLEMTGLGEEHVVLEVAIIITDEKLNIVDKFPDSELGLAIKRSEEELSKIEPCLRFIPALLKKRWGIWCYRLTLGLHKKNTFKTRAYLK